MNTRRDGKWIVVEGPPLGIRPWIVAVVLAALTVYGLVRAVAEHWFLVGAVVFGGLLFAEVPKLWRVLRIDPQTGKCRVWLWPLFTFDETLAGGKAVLVVPMSMKGTFVGLKTTRGKTLIVCAKRTAIGRFRRAFTISARMAIRIARETQTQACLVGGDEYWEPDWRFLFLKTRGNFDHTYVGRIFTRLSKVLWPRDITTSR
jgi:hypothetical protein